MRARTLGLVSTTITIFISVITSTLLQVRPFRLNSPEKCEFLHCFTRKKWIPSLSKIRLNVSLHFVHHYTSHCIVIHFFTFQLLRNSIITGAVSSMRESYFLYVISQIHQGTILTFLHGVTKIGTLVFHGQAVLSLLMENHIQMAEMRKVLRSQYLHMK